MTPHYADDSVQLFHGDCLDVLGADENGYDSGLDYGRLRLIPDNSVDAIVTDPPYGLGFMGKAWDSPARMVGQDNGPAGGGSNYFKRKGDEGYTPGNAAWYGHNDPRAFQQWCELWTAECLRVLKPGGHLLAFGGTRTWHRLAVAVEDAGFEIRDSIAWMYGSGFPKSLDVSKAIDKAAGAEREVVGDDPSVRARKPNLSNMATHAPGGFYRWGDQHYQWDDLPQAGKDYIQSRHAALGQITAPATDAARQWQGFGTALKPAFEPVVVARKPLIGTVAGNVLAHGVGALNIDGCRVGYTSDADKASARPGGKATSLNGALAGKEQLCAQPGSTEPSTPATTRASSTTSSTESASSATTTPQTSRTEFEVKQGAGRWPANVILDEDQAAALDQQSGTSKSSVRPPNESGEQQGGWGLGSRLPQERGHADSGGASRFFYVAKAPKKERPVVDGGLGDLGGETEATVNSNPAGRWPANVVLDEDQADALDEQSGISRSAPPGPALEPRSDGPVYGAMGGNGARVFHGDNGGASRFFYVAKAPKKERPVVDGVAHATVKPLTLMRWLVRLVTPPGGLVLEPFAGSGTTVEACILEGFRCLAIEREADYLPLILARIESGRAAQAAAVTEDDLLTLLDGGAA